MVFEDLPKKRNHGGIRARLISDDDLAKLKKHRKKWARLLDYERQSSAQRMQGNLKLRHKGFEFATRSFPDGTFSVYGRAL